MKLLKTELTMAQHGTHPPMLQLRRVREYWLTFVEEPCSASALQLGQAAGSGGGLRFRDHTLKAEIFGLKSQGPKFPETPISLN